MNRAKAFSGIMLTLLLVSMLILAFDIQPVKASGIIYIRADGSIEPDTAPISSVNNVTYIFTDNVNESIVVERDNILVDGAGYTLQGTGSGIAINLTRRSNVTIKNIEIKAFYYGIYLHECSNNSIFGNNITKNNWYAVGFDDSSNNTISGNNITNNPSGIFLYHSSNNIIYHNNFTNNTQQVYIYTPGYANVWDDGYPSGGNYWSDYIDVDLYSGPYQNETGSDGIGDTAYVIDDWNRDNYPLMYPSGAPPSPLYALTLSSSPIGLTFTVNGIPHTTPWTETAIQDTPASLLMPEIHTVGQARYYWDQWSDGNTSRSRTVTMTTNITLTAHYTGPYYQLTVASLPITGIQFTINGAPKTTPYTEWLLEGSYTLEMPESHDEYVWSHWLEDGDTNIIKTITLPDGTTYTAMYTVAPIGGTTIAVKSSYVSSWIASTLLITFIVFALSIYLKRNKSEE